ncbi:hypothetical protein AK812_SmicGene26918 [Symbiodinium microadriaticum]|uniref:Uncharacterized protein n=1 Tax=Symbiodinium microadriaticum TaxID=2951 RepID=A0A1Q9D8A1_SYMMI|nr:hypothetical protein AK812_SmicGene26918 [Symbiodinium microadriaticum]
MLSPRLEMQLLAIMGPLLDRRHADGSAFIVVQLASGKSFVCISVDEPDLTGPGCPESAGQKREQSHNPWAEEVCPEAWEKRDLKIQPSRELSLQLRLLGKKAGAPSTALPCLCLLCVPSAVRLCPIRCSQAWALPVLLYMVDAVRRAGAVSDTAHSSSSLSATLCLLCPLRRGVPVDGALEADVSKVHVVVPK